MGKRLTFIVALAVSLISVAPATATDVDPRAVEDLAIQLEALLGTIEGVDFDNVTVKRYDNGMTALSVPLPAEQLVRLRAAKAAGAKDFAPLAVGIQLSTPSSTSALIHAATALVNTTYNLWCAVVNLRATDQTKNTKLQMKGVDTVSGSVSYDANSATVVGSTPTTPNQAGRIVTNQCKVTGGGKAKSKSVLTSS